MNEKILVVGGSFNNEGGCPSEIVDKLCSKIEGAMIINGGLVDFLKNFIEEGIKDYNIVYWIPEEVEGIGINDIKSKNPKCFIFNGLYSNNETEENSENSLSKDANITLEIKSRDEGIVVSGISSSGENIFENISLEDAAEKIVDKKIFSTVTKKIVPASEPTIMLERLHLRVSETGIDILYRPNHNYFAFVPNDENGKAEVKRIAEMTREEFSAYLKTKSGMPRLVKTDIPNIKSSRAEEWWLGAWKMQTDALLKELNIENPIEEPIWKE